MIRHAIIAAIVAMATGCGDGKAPLDWDAAKNNKEAISHLADKTLSWFGEQDSADRRDDIVPTLMAYYGADKTDVAGYTNCIGDLAVSKSQDLKLVDVFGWCKTESDNNRERFLQHINELDIPDRSVMAGIICNNIITEQLISPASADFPFVPDMTRYKGNERYAIRTHVDSQNAAGAMLRSGWFCDIQFSGVGDDADRTKWKVHAVEQQS